MTAMRREATKATEKDASKFIHRLKLSSSQLGGVILWGFFRMHMPQIKEICFLIKCKSDHGLSKKVILIR